VTAAGLLLLADSRLPSGGHGHSGGVEALVDRGLLGTVEELAVFLAGRLATGAAVPAGAAAAGCALAGLQQGDTAPIRLEQGDIPPITLRRAGLQQGDTAPIRLQQGDIPPIRWEVWDDAVSARLPASATRAASYAQGAALLRTASIAWRSAGLDGLRALRRAHHPLVLGAAAAAVGATPADAAMLAVHHLIGGACTAAVRLLGLDPLAVASVAARAGSAGEPVAAEATLAALTAVTAGDPGLLPADGNPLHDVMAQLHRSKEATLFAS
jgi:urease accessory protein